MARADLHVHSKYSKHPSNWFLQRIGASESYTDPQEVFDIASDRGMDFVTITDHNKIEGSLLLKQKYPDRVFTGVESTAYFPEEKCKVHILIYGLDERQYGEVQRLRTDIYQLRDFIKENRLAHSVAHGTYSVNGKLSLAVLEKLILLFDVFEGINGARIRLHNNTWIRALMNLTPETIDDLYGRHRIDPMSNDPWIKGFTGGSDDHAGLFIGKTFTVADTNSTEGYLSALRDKKTLPDGRHNNYQSLAFAIYKIAYDFSRSKENGIAKTMISQITEAVFSRQNMNLKDQLAVRYLRSTREYRESTIKSLFLDLVENLQKQDQRDIEKKLDMVYDKIGGITDEFFKIIIKSFLKNMGRGNLEGLIKSISSSLLGVFLSVPFYSTLKIMHEGRDLLERINEKFKLEKSKKGKKILWFTDTYEDLNGVASTVREISSLSSANNRDIHIVTTLPAESAAVKNANVINLESFYEFTLPYYETLKLRMPSMLRAVKQLYPYEADEIYISTPGPVGMLGLLLSRLMNAKCVGIYHTDFAIQTLDLTEDDSVYQVVEGFSRWFYQACDEILVPTREYIDILEERGIDRTKMKLFKRAIDGKVFFPRVLDAGYLRNKYKTEHQFTLLYAGRVSKDKNMDFLVDMHRELGKKGRKTNLIIAGDGPYYEEMEASLRSEKSIIFTGRLPRKDLPELYSAADLFVFPSVTDTFGMVVLEAQACGLPAVVSTVGGPKEIIIEGQTGTVVEAGNLGLWVDAVDKYIELKSNSPEEYAGIRRWSSENGLSYNWETVFTDVLDMPMAEGEKLLVPTTTDHRDVEATA